MSAFLAIWWRYYLGLTLGLLSGYIAWGVK